MEQKKHYLVYKTTNDLNGMYYIGKHATYNPNDTYLGSGVYLTRAIEKYGKEHFHREILFDFDTEEEMDAKERELVNESLVKDKMCYNLMLGGEGGFDFINKKHRNTVGITRLNATGENNKSGQCYATRNRIKVDADYALWFSNRIKEGQRKSSYEFGSSFRGKHHTEETKQKIREKNRILMCGERNGSFGKVWIYNEEFHQNKMVKREESEAYINQGWKLGRRNDFYTK